MKIEPGYWRTRRGDKVNVVAVDVDKIDSGYTVIGVLDGAVLTWGRTGRYTRMDNDSMDLIEPWTEPVTAERVLWLVRYSEGECHTISNRPSDGKPETFGTIIGSTRVTVTEGVFA